MMTSILRHTERVNKLLSQNGKIVHIYKRAGRTHGIWHSFVWPLSQKNCALRKNCWSEKELRNLVKRTSLLFLNFKRYFDISGWKTYWCFWLFLGVHEKQRPKHRTSSESLSIEGHMEVSTCSVLKLCLLLVKHANKMVISALLTVE